VAWEVLDPGRFHLPAARANFRSVPILRRFRQLALLLVPPLALACDRSSETASIPAGPAPDSFRVLFQTSKGSFVVEARRAWAPAGVDRFHQLVSERFFDENRFYRVLPRQVAQFGASGDKKRNETWDAKPLPDDPPGETNARGTVSFAHSGPNSRTHQLFINLKDNARLDAEGFTPIGRVVEGMSVVDSLYSDYGNIPKYYQIARFGNRYLRDNFPELDYIRTARIDTSRAATR
jgi:peptidyl-prolyl cis-trans isomerase A (cyclophilin A)